MSLKWLSLSKLEKKLHTTPLQAGLRDELFSAAEMLLFSIQVRKIPTVTQCNDITVLVHIWKEDW